MVQDSIKCPKCGESIPLSEALSHDIEERARKQYELQLSTKEAEYQTLLKNQSEELTAKLKQQAREEVSAEITDLKAEREENKQKLKQAQENELALRTGMYGDLEGLAGTALPQIKVLELPTASSDQERANS